MYTIVKDVDLLQVYFQMEPCSKTCYVELLQNASLQNVYH